MSGSAGISILQEGVFYSYEEHGRKILAADDYEDYFARKHSAMLGALAFTKPEFQAWRKSVAAAGLQIEDAPIFRTDEKDPRLSNIRLDGARGETRLTIEWQKPPTEVQKKKLEELSARLEFSKLDEKWSAAGSPEAAKEVYFKGVMVARGFHRYSLALAMTAEVPRHLEPAVRRALERRMEMISPVIANGFEEHVASNTMWIDPKTLLPYEKVLGPLPKGQELNEPQRSRFNFFGPIFDSVGGRTARAIGHVKASMLFLSSNKDWDKDPKFGPNRGAFETWFSWATREPGEVATEMQSMLQGFLESAAKNADEQRSAQEKIEWVLKQPALYAIATKPLLQKLRSIAMDKKADAKLVRHVLDLLVWIPSFERDQTVRDWLTGRLYSGGSEGTTPIIVQAAQRIVSSALALESPQPESLQMLEILVSEYKRADLPDEDRSWVKNALQTIDNSIRSALEDEKAGRAFDKAFILRAKGLLEGLKL